MMLIINMKQIFLIVTLLFFAALTGRAQQFQGGMAAGLVGSQVAGDTYSGYHKLGAYTAFWVKLSLSRQSSVQTEISYFQKGSRHNPDSARQDFTVYKMRLGYIEMPFMYQYQLKSRVILEMGPSFSFLLHSFEELDYMEVSYGKFSLVNPSFTVGVQYPLTERLSAHFRMNSSVLSIRSDKINGARHRIFDYGQYNDCILLFLSYRF